MRSAKTVLGIIRDRGRRGLPLERVYRLLYNRDLYLLAYGKLARNAGALTPGTTGENADGINLTDAYRDRWVDINAQRDYEHNHFGRTFIVGVRYKY